MLRVRVLVGKWTKSAAVRLDRGCKGAEKQGCQKNYSLQMFSSLLCHWALSWGAAKEKAQLSKRVMVRIETFSWKWGGIAKGPLREA